MTALKQIKQRESIEARISQIHHEITMINLHPKAVDAADMKSRVEYHVARHGQDPKSERAKADLKYLQERMKQSTEIHDKARAEEDALRNELESLQDELQNLSISFSKNELEAANKRIVALEEEEQNVILALEDKNRALAIDKERSPISCELRREEEDLLAKLAVGVDVRAPMAALQKKIGEFHKEDGPIRSEAQLAKSFVAGLQRRLVEVRNELSQAKEDAQKLTRLFVLDEIAREIHGYSNLKEQIATSFTRIISLSELIPSRDASAIMPASGAFRLYIPAFRLAQGDAELDVDFNVRGIDRPSAVAAERVELIAQGARL